MLDRTHRHVGRTAGKGLAYGIALAALTGLSFQATPASADEASVVVARAMDFNSLDPARGWCDSCQIYLTAAYEQLVTLGPDNKTIEPRIAKSWESNKDFTEFTFKLDPAAKFADGSPVEAKDVKWSLERFQHIKGSAAFLVDSIASIEAPDAATVIVKTKSPNSELVSLLGIPYASILNSDVAIANGATAGADAAASDTADKWLFNNSAGSGPYTLVHYKADDELRLQRNEAYWRAKPKAATIIMKQAADAVTQLQMLQSGAADIAMQIDPDTSKTVSDPNIVFEVVPSFNFVYAALSPAAKDVPVELNKDIREAIALAIDYKGMIDFTIGGQGKYQPAAIPNGFPGTENLPQPKEDLERAKELLAKGGQPDGFTIDAKFATGNAYGVDISLAMQKLQQDLGRIGVQLNLLPTTYNVWISEVDDPGIPLTIGYYAPDYYGSGQYIQFFSMLKDMPWGKRAGVGKTPGLDGDAQEALLKKALASAGDAQVETYAKLAQMMIDDRIVLPLVSPDLILAYRKGVKGVRYSACCNLPLSELEKN